jgi:cysteinyl-tRNA synthetase
MSTRYLGKEFDLHAGGQDLIFPHHENEIAQSVCSHGGAFSRHWIHNGFVNIDSEKMSKSLGNFFTIRDVLELFHPQCIRFFLLTTHYRGPIKYSDANLREATRRIYSVYATLERIDDYLEQRKDNHKQGPVQEPDMIDAIVPSFEAAMNDDFNTPLAIGNLSEPIRKANLLLDGKEKSGRYATLTRLREEIRTVADVLRVFHRDPRTVMAEIQSLLIVERGIKSTAIDQKLLTRAQARADRDFAAADAIRDELLSQKILIMDRPEGTTWRIEP